MNENEKLPTWVTEGDQSIEENHSIASETSRITAESHSEASSPSDEPLPEWLSGDHCGGGGSGDNSTDIAIGHPRPLPQLLPQQQPAPMQPPQQEPDFSLREGPELGGYRSQAGFAQPAWFQSMFSNGEQQSSGGDELLIPDGKAGRRERKRLEGPLGSEGCCKTAKRVCCSFKTALVPVLSVSSLLALGNFVLRFVLRCSKWDGLLLWASGGSLIEFFVGSFLLRGLIKGDKWLCTGCFFCTAFSLFSVAVLIAEWLKYSECKGVEAKDDDGSHSLPTEIIPLIDTLQLPLFSSCAYLFKRGIAASRDAEERRKGKYGGAPDTFNAL